MAARQLTPAVSIGLLALGSSGAWGQTWTGGAGSGDPRWSTAANWRDGIVPNGATADVLFAGIVTQPSVRLDKEFDIRSVTFTPGVSPMTFAISSRSSGGVLQDVPLRLGAGGITNNIAGGTTQTVECPLFLTADQSFTTILGGNLVVGSADTQAFNRINLGLFSLTVGGAGDTTLASPVVGSGGLIKSGTGMLHLTRQNTYSGSTTIQQGEVRLSGQGALGQGAISVGPDGMLRFTGSTSARSATIQSRNLTFEDTSTADQSNIRNSGTLEFMGASSADRAIITNNNISTVRLNFRDSASAANAIITNEAAMDFYNASTAGSATITSRTPVIFHDSASAGSSLLVINSWRIDFLDNSTAENATIRVNSATNFMDASSAGNANIENNSIVRLLHNSTAEGATIINSAGAQLDVRSHTGSTGVSVGSLTGSGSVNLGATKLTLGTLGKTEAFDGTILGTGSVVKAGTGTLTLSGDHTYTGATEVARGTLILTGASSSSVFRATGGTLQLNPGVLLPSPFLQFSAGAGGTIRYTDIDLTGGYLYGPGVHILTDTTLLGTTVFSGSVEAGAGAALQAVQMNGALRVTGTELTWQGGTLGSGGSLVVGAGKTVTLNSVALNGTTQVSRDGVLRNTDAAPLTLGGGSRTTIGTPTRPGGTVDLGGQSLELNGGLLVNNGVIQNGLVKINYGGLAKGAGTYAGGYQVNDGGRILFGNSPGLVTSGSAVWGAGGAFSFQIADANGVAGTAWGFNDVQGSLSLLAGATPASRFTITLESLLPDGTTGGFLAGFRPTQDYSWQFLSAHGGITGFNAAFFALDTSGFRNDLQGGTFSLAQRDNGLYIHFTARGSTSAAPEPGTLALLALGGAFGIFRARRKNRDRATGTPPPAVPESAAAPTPPGAASLERTESRPCWSCSPLARRRTGSRCRRYRGSSRSASRPPRSLRCFCPLSGTSACHSVSPRWHRAGRPEWSGTVPPAPLVAPGQPRFPDRCR
jgi:autotransporter-associated beta strand protein